MMADFCSVPGVGSEAEAVSNAQWRGMQAMAALCLAHGTGSPPFCAPTDPHSLLSAQLLWLTATDTLEASAVPFHAPLHTRFCRFWLVCVGQEACLGILGVHSKPSWVTEPNST